MGFHSGTAPNPLEKEMNHLSPFVRRLARDYHEVLAPLALLRVAVEPATTGKKS